MADQPEDPKPLQDEELAGAIRNELEVATVFVDTDLGLSRARATKFYRGDKFGDEEPGRSQIVMPVVRDTARATLPALMRIFFGGQRVMEFSPGAQASSRAAQAAADATATVNHVVMNQNPGWSILWNAFKDGLVRKSGWLTWWWDDSEEITARDYSGVSEEQLHEMAATIMDDEQLDVLGKTQVGTQMVPSPPQPEVIPHPVDGSPVMTGNLVQAPPQQVPVFEYTIRLTKKAKVNKVKIECVPPEEIIFSPECASIDGERPPLLIGRRQMKTRGQLIKMGVPEELLKDAGNGELTLENNPEQLARNPRQQMNRLTSGQTPDQDKLGFYDLYFRVDADGDGIDELLHVQCVGSNLKVWNKMYAEDVNLALLCPDPEPHVLIGMSQADSLMDLQLMISHVWRDVLDSLKLSIFPRTAYVEGQANVDDILNTEIGAAIRMRQPGMVQELTHSFTGQQAFPLFELFDQIREQRTGVGKAAMGMDADALQSTTPAAAIQSITAAQSQIELIARVFAETGMKRLFRGVLKLLCRNQDHKMQFRLNGHDYVVNPLEWDENMDLSIDTGLGTGNPGLKIQTLQYVDQQQQAAIGSMGPDNPLCSLQEAYNLRVAMLELAGFHDVQRFWRNPTESMKQGKQIQSPKSPEQTLAEAEMSIKQASEQREMLQIVLDDDRAREAQTADLFFRAADIFGKYGITVNLPALQQQMNAHHVEAANAAAATSTGAPPHPSISPLPALPPGVQPTE